MKSKKLLNSMAVLMLLVAVFVAIPQAHAQETATSKSNMFQGLIDAISKKFNLDKEQVKTVVDEYHTQQKTQMQKDMQAREKTRLDQLVTDGKITAAQRDAIIKKLAELKSKYTPENMKDKTPEERKAQMDAMKTEIKAWAEAQGIDESYLHPGFGMGRGMRGGMHRINQ